MGEVSRDQWGITSGLRPWNPDDPLWGPMPGKRDIGGRIERHDREVRSPHDRMMWEGPGDRNQNEVNVRFQTRSEDVRRR